MKNKKSITLLVLMIMVIAAFATTAGIFSSEGGSSYVYRSIRGKEVIIYGKGLYKDMSAEVAPQGIAQDWVTLLVGIPLLAFSLLLARKGSLKGRYLLTGTVGYFLVTYLFFTVMGMYNKWFVGYVVLMGLSFYAFIALLLTFDQKTIPAFFKLSTPFKATGGFLIFNAIAIALLWLSTVVPPLLDGTIIPVQAEHYTTLIVQGLDLGILLPGAFIYGLGITTAYLQPSAPFANYFIPGLVLFTVVGVWGVVIAVLAILQSRHYAFLVLVQGCILLGWIAIQPTMVTLFHPLHLVIAISGMVLIVFGWRLNDKQIAW